MLTSLPVALALLIAAAPASPRSPYCSAALEARSDPDLARAVRRIEAGKYDEALVLLNGVLERDPSECWAWYQSGLAHHLAGRLDQALANHRSALVGSAPRGHRRSHTSYNIACVHALKGQAEHALQWLHRARIAGWPNPAALRSDADLSSLHGDPRFEALIANFAIPRVPGVRVSSITPELPGGTGGVAINNDGVLYVSDFSSNVWRIQPGGERELLSDIFTKAAGSAFDAQGRFLQVDHQTASVWRFTPGQETPADLGLAGLKGPVGIVAESDGTLTVADYRLRAVVQVAPGGQSTILAQGGQLRRPNGILRDRYGDYYVVDHSNGTVLRVHPTAPSEEAADSAPTWRTSFVAELPGGGNGHIVSDGEIFYVTSRLGNCVYRVTRTGTVALVAGDGSRGVRDGEGATARLAYPNGLAIASDGRTLWINDQVTRGRFVVRRIELPER